jgi:RNA polymerase sigma-70 factor (ECF subfamily)
VLIMLTFYLSLIDDDEEQQKFERIYYQYRNLMYYAAYKILNDHQNAEDAVQAAFIRIANNIEKLDEKKCQKTKAFAVIVTERIAINLYNKQKRENCIAYDDVSYDIATGEILENVVLDNLLAVDVLKRISELPIKYCEVLTLKYVHGLSGKEIAKMVEASHTTVRKRIERGLAMLNIELKDEQ